jgi:hypothetical protein
MMRTILIGGAGALLLAGCAYDEGGPRYAGEAGYNASAAVGYDAFYDDFYGPFYDGYWGPGDVFFYSEAAGRPFHRDDAHHFRHDTASGFHAVHGLGQAARGPVNPPAATTPRAPH